MFVYLKKSGFYTYDKENDYQIINKSLARHLTDYIKIDNSEGEVTIGDLFYILFSLEEDIDYLFKSYTRGFKIGKFIDDIERENETVFNDLDFVEFSWGVDYIEYEDDDLNIIKEITDYVGYSGVNDSVKEDEQDMDNSRYYSIDSSSLSSYKHLPIIINSDYKIFDNTNKEYLLDATKEMCLIDFVGGFLNDLTFFGYPENRDEKMEELNERVDSIDRGEEELIPFEQVQLNFLEEDFKRLIENEKYEKADKVKKEIEELKKKLKSYNSDK